MTERKQKELVVLVDEEARANLTALNFRYFDFRDSASKEEKEETYRIETPLGKKREVKGILINKPNLREHGAEYIYLEILDTCNFSCSCCGVGRDIRHISIDDITSISAEYITPEFVEKFSEQISIQPFMGIRRKFFYGGGEPLLNPQEFKRVISGFNDIQKTVHIVSTNGCSIPLDYGEFVSFAEEIGKPYIFMTLSEEHKNQYTKLRQTNSEKLEGYIPQNVPEEDALKEKVKIIGEHCNKAGIGFKVNTLQRKGLSELRDDLRKYIIRTQIGIISTELNGYRAPCSKGQEMAIRSNGELYPHCYDIFTKTNKIGIVGLLSNSTNA